MMSVSRGPALLLVVVSVSVGACAQDRSPGADTQSGDSSGKASFEEPFTDVEAYPVFASSEIAVGRNRLLVALFDGDDDSPIGSPDVDVRLEFFDLSTERPLKKFETETEFVPIDARRGLYQADVTFPSAGQWGAEVHVSAPDFEEDVRASFDVAAEPSTPEIGERVPPSDTPTADDAGKLSDISTDRHPDPRFYERSVAQVVRAKEPFVLVFATPKFCQSATCGPMLRQVKAVARDFPRFTFIHVEPYDLAEIQKLEPTEAAVEWGLPSEPWTFVVDARGRLVSKYEGVLDGAGLRADIRGL